MRAGSRRARASNVSTGAVYMTITNSGAADDKSLDRGGYEASHHNATASRTNCERRQQVMWPDLGAPITNPLVEPAARVSAGCCRNHSPDRLTSLAKDPDCD